MSKRAGAGGKARGGEGPRAVPAIPAAAARQWAGRARAAGLLSPRGLAGERAAAAPGLLFPASVRFSAGCSFALCLLPGQRALGIFGPGAAAQGFDGTDAGPELRLCPLGHGSALRLRSLFRFAAPSPLAGTPMTIGLGDRLGTAGPGHIRACRGFSAAPVLAQQSVRELDLTGRDFPQVLDAATWAVFQEGYTGLWGADGDHLKTAEWVKTALEAGFTMITADVSDSIAPSGSGGPGMRSGYEGLDPAYRRRIEESYLPRRISLDTGEEVSFTEQTLARAAVVYHRAVEHALALYRAGVEAAGEGGFDFELSVDETDSPTSAVDHAFVAMEVMRGGARLSSLAPRFIGEFQKGIDYVGDVNALDRDIATHAALCRALGYRLSVHSGSDKFAAFPCVGRRTRGSVHIKTSGTSWLIALGVTASGDPALFRELYRFALERFPEARRLYHVTPALDRVPAVDGLSDEELPRLLELSDVRQVLHISYGEILRQKGLRDRLFASLDAGGDAYGNAVEGHIRRHLEALGVPPAGG